MRGSNKYGLESQSQIKYVVFKEYFHYIIVSFYSGFQNKINQNRQLKKNYFDFYLDHNTHQIYVFLFVFDIFKIYTMILFARISVLLVVLLKTDSVC